ncbi:MAG: diaminopimelate dehydrogenase, partial [Coriobacteriales bacterium]|nr:diaminopimelate dehydrogenase [Coriobacteriales bacterium]
MDKQTRIGIVGYGNLGRGVEAALMQNADMELVGVFTRRDPASVELIGKSAGKHSAQAYRMDELEGMKGQIDVLIICGGSATDLPQMTPQLAQDFTVVDSFDTHAKIPEHFAAVDAAARANGKLAVISVGWDPGLFSLNRALAQAILPAGKSYTFWGKGVSQGHSDAIRRIPGVRDARQYTIPVESAMQSVRAGEAPELTTREKHTRLCYVVTANDASDADRARIEQEIVTMPNYFDEYDTTVHFISAEEMAAEHSGLPHGGVVFRSGETGFGDKNMQIIEYQLRLDSNPEFTSSVLVAYARAACKMAEEGQTGCRTVFDIPPSYLMAIT